MPLFSKNSLILRLVPPNLLIFYLRTIVFSDYPHNAQICFDEVAMLTFLSTEKWWRGESPQIVMRFQNGSALGLYQVSTRVPPGFE